MRTFDAPEALDIRFHEVRAKSALNKVPKASRMPFRWTINPYRGCTHACVYCFARPTHAYLGFDAGRDFEREIVVKVNVPEVLRAELARPSWKREHVALGTNTDPYQWVEGRYGLMPGIWEALRDSRTPVLGPDQVAAAAARHRAVRADRRRCRRRATSRCRRSTRRPGAPPSRTRPHPRKRARGGGRAEPGRHPDGRPDRAADARHQRLAGAGRADRRAVRRGRRAISIGGIALHLRGEVRERLLGLAAPYRPDLVPRYEQLYARGAYAPQAERERMSSLVRAGRRVVPGLRRDPAGSPEDASRRWPPRRPSSDALLSEGFR